MVLKDFITENDTNHLNSEPAEKDIQPNAPTDKDCHKKSDEIREGIKSTRISYIDNQPTVHVVYTSLTRESKKMLNMLLHQWSEWQGQHESSSNDSSKEKLESGEETYFAAIRVGDVKSSGLTFWVDNQAKKEENMESTVYDRAFFLGSNSSNDASYYSERFERSEASRCFNCASYSHSLRECPKARDNAAISNARNLHSADIRNMLTEAGKVLVRDKLDEWYLTVVAKSTEKNKTDLRKKEKMNEKEEVKEDSASPGDASVSPFENKTDKFRNNVGQTSIFVTQDEKASSDMDDPQPMSIAVPDPDFHDFDEDRSEKSFEPDQVWATYDDEDGMPRFYCFVQKVISLKPFKCRMTFLNSRTNMELGPLNWVGMGFAKTCGDFRVSRYEVNDRINIFSHKVKWEKGPRGIIKILPQKGDTWALYRNWSPDWNEHTPDDVIYKYDMVEVLDEYNEEQGVTITTLVKVDGFKTVFRRHPDPNEVKRIPREEMFRFSHRVPSYLLTGMESEGAPEGCHELDPAATPLELLQVATNAKEEENGETSEKKTVE